METSLLNQVGGVYGSMDEVLKFAATFKEYPPRSFPPSFVPTTIMEEMLEGIKDARTRGGERRAGELTAPQMLLM